jgi:hypothetical protein
LLAKPAAAAQQHTPVQINSCCKCCGSNICGCAPQNAAQHHTDKNTATTKHALACCLSAPLSPPLPILPLHLAWCCPCCWVPAPCAGCAPTACLVPGCGGLPGAGTQARPALPGRTAAGSRTRSGTNSEIQADLFNKQFRSKTCHVEHTGRQRRRAACAYVTAGQPPCSCCKLANHGVALLTCSKCMARSA